MIAIIKKKTLIKKVDNIFFDLSHIKLNTLYVRNIEMANKAISGLNKNMFVIFKEGLFHSIIN